MSCSQVNQLSVITYFACNAVDALTHNAEVAKGKDQLRSGNSVPFLQ